jgi:hexosaminidase
MPCGRAVIAICVFVSVARAWADDTQAAAPAIVPCPAELKLLDGQFLIQPSTSILVEAGQPEVRKAAESLAGLLRLWTDYELPLCDQELGEAARGPADSIVVRLHPSPAAANDEGYSLVIKPDAVLLDAPRTCGLLYGVVTIVQLLTGRPDAAQNDALRYQLPALEICDHPRYRWRGMLLDCGRHFMTKEFVKRYIDLLAMHKMNVLHWHLTEDQGWRIEIKKYPKLAEVGAWRQATRADEQPRDADGRYGGFYTQVDIRELVAYAKAWQITIVPEIEMPGHSRAALASYPELSCTGGPFTVGTEWGVFDDVYCAGNDHTFEFLQDVLTEVLDLFPSEFIHIGGDEVPKTRWKACPKCQARIKAEGLKDENELQSYFVRRIENFLNSKGRRLVGWDEILEGGLAPNATVQSWRGMDAALAAARAGHDVISSPTSHCYLDYLQTPNPAAPSSAGLITLEKTYSFEPTPPELTPEQAAHILGVEGSIWTERAPQKWLDHQVFPRLCALAEVTWSPAAGRDWTDFTRRMAIHYARLDALGVTYCIPPPRLVASSSSPEDGQTVVVESPPAGGEIHYTLDGSDPTRASPLFVEPLHLPATARLKARTFLKRGNVSDMVEFHFQK